MPLPGWDSIGLTSTYAKFFTYAGFFALFALLVFEILGHLYSGRETTLREAVATREADDRRADADARIAERASAEANGRAAENQKEAARITKENLQLQGDVLKLRTKLADRHLSDEQITALARALVPFAGAEGEPVRHRWRLRDCWYS